VQHTSSTGSAYVWLRKAFEARACTQLQACALYFGSDHAAVCVFVWKNGVAV